MQAVAVGDARDTHKQVRLQRAGHPGEHEGRSNESEGKGNDRPHRL